MSPVWLSIAAVWAERERWLAMLTASEHATFSKLTVLKRQQDFLAGRVAAKRAGQRRWGPPLHCFEIRTDTGPTAGRPRLYWGDTARFVSITHSGDLAGAVASDAPVGLDAERITPRDASFEALVFGRPLGLSAEAQTARWCQLEAYAKWLGTGLRAHFAALAPPDDLPQRRGQVRHQDQNFWWVAYG